METRFGDQLRQTRHTLGLSLAELSTCSGVSRAALSKIERGERNPSLSNALQIAEALGTPLGELVGQGPRPATVVRDGEAPRVIDPASKVERESLLEPQVGTELVRYIVPPHTVVAPFRPHEDGTRESFVILAGEIVISSGDLIVHLAAGDAATMPGDRSHQFRNQGHQEARLLLLILRPRQGQTFPAPHAHRSKP